MISLDSTSNISIRLGEMEMFIAAPNDEKFKNLMATISPDAKYDNILQEWRISAEKLSFEELNEKLSYGIKQIEKSSMPSSKIGAIGQEHGYAEIKVGEGGEVQIDSLRERGIPDERLYFDRLEGRFPERPYLDRCLDALQPGDILYVHCLDRVARSLKQLANTVAKIESKNAYLRSLTEPFDSSADQYKYFSKHISFAAEFEMRANSERTKAGLRERAAKGKKVGGRPKSLTKEKIETIARLSLAEKSIEEIAEAVGVSPSTIYRTISNPTILFGRAHADNGQEGVKQAIRNILSSMNLGITTDVREEILSMHRSGKAIAWISEKLDLNLKTVRNVIHDDD